jgi:hypothetical protein
MDPMQNFYPLLYQVNTRVWLNSLSQKLGRKATLDDIPDEEFDRIKEVGFDWVWLLSVWQTGWIGKEISRANPEWRKEYEETLPDLKEEDIGGSGFSITGYTVHKDLGGNAPLKRIRKRLHKKGLRLMLDFVPNHTAIDHDWVKTSPKFYIEGDQEDLLREPKNFIALEIKGQQKVFAHGRDPFFPGWTDTLQLNYANPELQDAMIGEIEKVSQLCDGVRCDMAMLILPEIFKKTWGRKCDYFWPKAIQKINSIYPEFKFMAEVYWDLEWQLQQQGFDYTYDKKLFDRLKAGKAGPVREHLYAGMEFQSKMARFLENHYEERAASEFDQKKHEAAAIITYFSPGLRFFQQGQFEGNKKRISPHLVRGPEEPIDASIKEFYNRLLSVLKSSLFEKGHWNLLESTPTWEGNGTWDSFIAYAWQAIDSNMIVLVVVNYAPYSGQCFLTLPFPFLANKQWRLNDLMSGQYYDREGNSLLSKGLFLDMPAWHYHIFELSNIESLPTQL